MFAASRGKQGLAFLVDAVSKHFFLCLALSAHRILLLSNKLSLLRRECDRSQLEVDCKEGKNLNLDIGNITSKKREFGASFALRTCKANRRLWSVSVALSARGSEEQHPHLYSNCSKTKLKNEYLNNDGSLFSFIFHNCYLKDSKKRSGNNSVSCGATARDYFHGRFRTC